jgi:hypothetical protein
MSRQSLSARRRLTVPPISAVRRTRRRLGEQSLVQTLIQALDHGVTGSIAFFDPSGQDHALRLVQGLPAGAETRREIAPLGGILRSMGMSDEETLEVRLASGSRYDMLTARSMALRGKLSDELLREALRVQLIERVRVLLELPPDTIYVCHPDRNLLSSFHQREPIELGEGDLLQLLAESMRRKSAVHPVAETLKLLKHVELRLRDDAPIDLLGLTDDERLLAHALRDQPMTARELVGCDLVPRGVVGTLVYLLGILRFLALPGESRPPVGSKRRCVSGVVRTG